MRLRQGLLKCGAIHCLPRLAWIRVEKGGADEGDDLPKATVAFEATPRAMMHTKCTGDRGEIGQSRFRLCFLPL